MIPIVILAAGASTRMGTPKQLLSYQGRSFLRQITEVAIASVCEPVIVVLGSNADKMRSEISSLPVVVVENLLWTVGMSASIKTGMELLYTLPHLEAVVLTLCDQPFISPQIINQLVETYHFTNKPIIACQYADTLGVPAIFDHSLFAELTALQGTQGAKQIIYSHIHQVIPISFPQGAVDIDTPEDYQQLSKHEDYTFVTS